ALIGAQDDNEVPGPTNRIGAAYVFTRSGTTWSQQGPKIVASGLPQLAHFGSAVALSGDGGSAVVAGANGAFFFARSGNTWTQQGPMVAPAPNAVPSVALDRLGHTALISTYNTSTSAGGVFVFVRQGNSWMQQDGSILPGGVSPNGNRLRVAIDDDATTAIL